MSATERGLVREDYEAAGVVDGFGGMKGVYGFVVTGPKRTVYAARCDASRMYYAGWWVKAGAVVETVRTEKQARKLATRWATVGFPSEE